MAQHGIEEHSHGLVPLQTRNERPRSTSISDFSELSSRQEIWRYLPMDKLRGLDSEVSRPSRGPHFRNCLDQRFQNTFGGDSRQRRNSGAFLFDGRIG